MHKVFLLKGKEKPVLHHHNWVYSGAIAKQDKGIEKGDLVQVCNSNGEFLAYGYYNEDSKIRVRLLEWNEQVEIDAAWWEDKIRKAYTLRKERVENENTNAYRLVFSEGDGLPGLIVDKYADYLSVQFLTAGTDVRKTMIVEILQKVIPVKGIYERSDANARSQEGLQMVVGNLYGEKPPASLLIKENGLLFNTPIVEGQKSGYYLDQRENRKKVADYTNGKKVLDCFSYTGGFSLHAKQAGASEVWSVDSSSIAIEALKNNYKNNDLAFNEEQVITSDVFQYLRNAQQNGQHWDVIILDPPKLAPNRQNLPKAERAYKDLNLQALLLMKPGDILATFSCSGSLSLEHFKQILAWAATDAGKELQFLEDLGHPIDHPVRAAFPESSYLKGVIARVI
jgi:23S rRNA (cytosine1962-C5)-methyltransferase